MENFFENPFGRIQHTFACDVHWPNWIEGRYEIKTFNFEGPEKTEPRIEHKFHRPPMFENELGELAIELAEKRNTVFIRDQSGRLGELWLRRAFRSWRDLAKPTYYAEIYTYFQIHTDPLTSQFEGTGYRYKIETSARRNFDIFVSFSQKDQRVTLNRSHWALTMTHRRPGNP